jgi:hypothetical protein
LRQSKYETYGYWIALLIYAASYALANGSMMMATLLLGPCGFVAAWKLTLVADAFNKPRRPMIAARNRLARVGAAAVVVTACVIFAGVASRNHVTLAASERSDVANKNAKDEAPEAVKWGYESILLWPVPEKKKIIAPVLFHNSEQARGKSEPIVFRFVGTYWYFQPPEKRPGPRAHQAHGTPLLEDIASHNSAPLKMEAHQNLGTEIKLANCGEIQIQVENADNQPGAVSLEVDLIDSTTTGKSAISLGEQSLITTEAHHFSIKLAPEEEVVRFAVPKVAKVKKFDEIAVIFMPESRREKLGAKIAVREFRMVPR